MEDDLNNAETWKNRGNEFFSKGDYKSALMCYRHAIEINPYYASGWNNYGLALLKLGRIDDARAAKRKADELKKIQATKQSKDPSSTAASSGPKKSTSPEPSHKKAERKWCLACGAELQYYNEEQPSDFSMLCSNCSGTVKSLFDTPLIPNTKKKRRRG